MKSAQFFKRFFCVFILCLFLGSCSKGCNRSTTTKLDPLDMIPSDNRVLVRLDLKKLSSTPFFLEALKDAPPDVREISKSVDELILALNQQEGAGGPAGLAILSGRLDEKKMVAMMEASAKERGVELKKEKFEGYTLNLSPEDPNVALVFVSPSQALWGQLSSLRVALSLAAKKGGTSIRSNAELMSLFQQSDSKKVLWGAGVFPSPSSAPSDGSPNPADHLQDLRTIRFGVEYEKSMTIEILGTTDDAPKAESLVSLINNYKSTFGLALASQNPLLGEVIRGAELTSQDKTVHLVVRFSEALLQQVSKRADDLRKQEPTTSESQPSAETHP